MTISIAESTSTLQLLGDPTRLRLLALLARDELSVRELTEVLQLGQSRVSTHLARLREGGVVRDRRAGASTRWSLSEATMPEGARALWMLLADDLADPVLADDRRRSEALLRARRAGEGWPDAIAGQMERHYSPGRTWEALARALLGFARLGDVLDVGSGDGALAELIAPRARSVLCLDRSSRVARAAAGRLADVGKVRVVVGDAEALPAEGAAFDHVLLFNVLTCCGDPGRAIAEAARVLRPGGRTVVVTLAPHESAEQARAYGHVHAGFAPARVRRWLRAGGLDVDACAVTSREQREPHYRVVSAFASKPARSQKRRAR